MPNYGFAPTSRYYDVETALLEGADGRRTAYLRRRLLPDPALFADLRVHVVEQGERLDHIAARALGDPEAFWRIWDANAVFRLADLVRTGRALRITLPQGIPAATSL